jgi:hypothetical protein
MEKMVRQPFSVICQQFTLQLLRKLQSLLASELQDASATTIIVISKDICCHRKFFQQ